MKAIISGGGTGGHVFPAIAIARALKAQEPGMDILFVGAKGKMEMQKVPAAGFKIVGLWISGFRRSLSASNILAVAKLLHSFVVSFRLLSKYRPDIAIGVGGYASGPLLRMASMMGIPIAIQEQNSYPGITNRVLGRKARLIFTAYPGMEAFFAAEKTKLTGNPVRQDVICIQGKKEEALAYFGLKPSKPVILIIGGSQGARSLNEAMEASLGRFDDTDRQWIWQTGKDFSGKAKALVDASGSGNTVVNAFIDRMDLAYAAADIIISRAGAIAISELCNIGKPVILVPFPHAAANHQEHNARRLEASGAALLIKDNELKRKLFETVNRLLSDHMLRESLAQNIRKWALPDADTQIARMIIDLINQIEKQA